MSPMLRKRSISSTSQYRPEGLRGCDEVSAKSRRLLGRQGVVRGTEDISDGETLTPWRKAGAAKLVEDPGALQEVGVGG